MFNFATSTVYAAMLERDIEQRLRIVPCTLECSSLPNMKEEEITGGDRARSRCPLQACGVVGQPECSRIVQLD
jgi:hypothetical protein